MIAVTPDITAQFVRVKQVCSIAKGLASKGDAANRIIATILLDYAAESALKTVYWSHPTTAPKKAKEVSFPELLSAVAALTGTPPSLPLQGEISNLHAQRGFTQHRNLTPSEEDVPRHVAYVEAFLRELCNRFFGLDFDTLSLSALVTHDELREHLLEAERLTAEHRYKDAVSESALALSKAILDADKLLKVTDSRFRPGFLTMHAQARFTRDQADLLGELAEAIARLRDDVDERIRVLALGLDYSSYMRYKAVAPFVSWTLDGAVHVDHRRKDYSAEEAASVFDYALNQILRLEAVGAPPGPADEE